MSLPDDIKPWYHRKQGEISMRRLPHTFTLYPKGHTNIYFRKDGRLVTEVCVGERYAHIAPGWLFNDEVYQGSYLDNWHGGPAGSLNDMLKWLRDAEHPEWEYEAWMIPPEQLEYYAHPLSGELTIKEKI